MTASRIRIEYRGRLAVTIRQAADRHGIKYDAMRQAVNDMETKGVIKRLPESIGRTPLYDAEQLDEAVKNRPGHGRAYPQTEDRRRKVA